MSLKWQPLSAHLAAMEGVSPEERRALCPHPVLVLGDIRRGSLTRKQGADRFGTHLYRSVSQYGDADDEGVQSIRVLPLFATGTGTENDWSPWFTLGRTTASDVVVNDYTISKTHARLRPNPTFDAVVVEDLGSTNGTWVSGRRLRSGQSDTLRSGEELRCGRFVMTFFSAPDFLRALTGA